MVAITRLAAPEEIANHLLKTVVDGGGWTRIRADVEEIIVEKDTAVGVRLKGGEEIRAKSVMSAAGVQSTVTRLLPESHKAKDWAKDISKLNPAPCHVCLYIGFKGDITKAGAGSANKWFYETWELTMTTGKLHPTVRCRMFPFSIAAFHP